MLRVPLGIPDHRTLLALLGLGLVSQLGGYLALTSLSSSARDGHIGEPVVARPPDRSLGGLLLGEPLRPTRSQAGRGTFGVGLANRLGKPEQERTRSSANRRH